MRWFTAAEVEAAASDDRDDWETPAGGTPGALLLPPRLAIARRLLERWLMQGD